MKRHSDEAAAKASWQKDEYLVALKLLLRDGDKLLLIHDQYGEWEIPGGRIRKDQFSTALEDILRDKVAIELGNDVKYEVGDIKTTFRIEREEVGRNGQKARIFGVGFEAKYLGGDIQLGEYHDKYEWIDLKTVNLEDYATPNGWIKQLEEYKRIAD